MANELDANSLKQDNHFAPLGDILLAARQAKKLSQNDVSNSLRISVKQINAIEHDDFAALPESAITRGFIRNYARFLGVDAEPLLMSHRARMPDNTPASLSVKTTTRHVMSKGHHQPLAKYMFAGLGLLLLLAVWFFYGNYMQQHKKAANVNDSASLTSLMPEVALPAAEREVLVNQPPLVTNNGVSETTSSTGSPSATQMHTVSAELPANQPLVASNVSAEVSGTAVAAATASYKVSLKFTGQTWVRAKNQAGKVIFEKTFAAGDVGGFDAEPPIAMTIGNASATQLQYLGQPVDLTAVTIGNVARVKLP